MNEEKRGLYLVMISIHGLFRGHDMELGRDADTGGQIQYVVELAKTLATQPEVDQVDILTRQLSESYLSNDYNQPEEKIADNASIIRLPCGSLHYLRKEVLWPHLDVFAEEAMRYLKRKGRLPDLVHSHYADAGYVGNKMAQVLEIPLIHTGHSLGRDKLRRLQGQGLKRATIESHYHITQRIETEEQILEQAELVIASTEQEKEEQYGFYRNYCPERMRVIPPGVDLKRFHPSDRKKTRQNSNIWCELKRFLNEPDKPMILAMSRPDIRKNISTLMKAYGESEELQDAANLVLILGTRDDITEMDRGPRAVLNDLFLAIDQYDLYGKVAYPKQHDSYDVPELYRLAEKSHGVFINPALTEPFGLTIIEAAASGLPVVATEDGGPQDIIACCNNGLLIDPLDSKAMAATLLDVVSNRAQWALFSKAGLQGVHKHFSWKSHSEIYLQAVQKVLSHQGELN